MKYKTVEPIPTWALDYLINGDTEGVNEAEMVEGVEGGHHLSADRQGW